MQQKALDAHTECLETTQSQNDALTVVRRGCHGRAHQDASNEIGACDPLLFWDPIGCWVVVTGAGSRGSSDSSSAISVCSS